MCSSSSSSIHIKEESAQERQENELQILQAMYTTDIKDLRVKVGWKIWRPLELQITLLPQQSMTMNKEINVQGDLYIKCTERYPNELPLIDIRNTKGLSYQDIAKLKSELLQVAKHHCGEVMILELTQCVQNFLHSCNKPQFESFYEEMICNQQKQKEEIAEKLKKQQEWEKKIAEEGRKAIEQEMQRKQEAIKEEAKRRRTRQSSIGNAGENDKCDITNLSSSPSQTSSEDSNPFHNNPKLYRSRSQSICRCNSTERGMATLTFIGKQEYVIYCGQCLGHSNRGCVVYAGMNKSTGDLVAITEWTLKWQCNLKPKSEEFHAVQKEQVNYLKQISSIEKEFKTLSKMHHENLVNYLGMKYNQEKDKISIFVLQEYVFGFTLAHKLSEEVPLTINQLQLYAKGILKALRYLHDNSIVHKNLRETSVFFDHAGKVRLSDYSLDKRLYDMYRSLTNDPEIDFFPPSVGRGGKKSDIYRVGILLLSLSSGSLVKDIVPTIPQTLNASLRDFLNKCLTNDEQNRWTANQLLSHPFITCTCYHGVMSKDIETKQEEKGDESTLLPMFVNEAVGGSRLQSEFEILKFLGSGGFGHVLKVKNRLDGRVYALKQIPLNPSNKQLNRKIMREVKLLSRLNHENIVRYYNSWIETTLNNEAPAKQDKNSPESTSKEIENADVDNFPPPVETSVTWSVSGSQPVEDESSDDDDDDDEYDVFGTSYCIRSELSSAIIFEHEENEENLKKESNSTVETEIQSSQEENKLAPSQYMYIQMEFCEKSTLRTAIDNGLYKEVSRVWRLFREIAEGLLHIHQQGMIHRDLKPLNIFLDLNDHVKIGDFGLATTDVITKPPILDSAASGDLQLGEHANQSRSDIVEDGTLTGKVGTALYLAPELASTTASKTVYNQKADIYSLGIIFFEMCYPTPTTAMERIKLIGSIRQPDILLPPDVKEHLCEEQVLILKWLLQHDHSKRPTSTELLASEYLPPLQMEEAELNELLCHTVSNPQSKAYKHMINALFNQEVSAAFDFTYDMDIQKGQPLRTKFTQIFSRVKEILNGIMKKHGAVYFTVPTLMPVSAVYENDTCVCVMDHGGAIVTLPHDLRVPFARHIARKEINNLKRYALEKVYREQKVFGCHPREQYEYAIDIVTPTPSSFAPDAEVLTVVSEIISEFPSLQSRNYYVRLNHILLLKAIFIHAGVDDKNELNVYKILGDPQNKNGSRLHLHNRLASLSLPDNAVAIISHFVETEESFSKISTILQPLTKKKSPVGSLVKKGLQELENIVRLSESLGIKSPIIICPGLAHEVKLFSGMIFQYVCQTKKTKHKGGYDILAAGGRYDKLIAAFKLKAPVECGKQINQSAVGVSIAVEKIVTAEMEFGQFQSLDTVEILVYSIGDQPMLKEKCEVLRELWSLGMSATIIHDNSINFEDAIDYCRDNGIPHILILKDTEPGIIKLRFVDRLSEKKLHISELAECIPKLCAKDQVECNQRYKAENVKNPAYSIPSSGSSLKFTFLPQDKMSSMTKKRHEAQITPQVMPLLQHLSTRVLEVLAVELSMSVVKTIVSECEMNADIDAFQTSFVNIIEKHPRHKKYLKQVSEEISEIKFEKQNPLIVLYSLTENNFKVLL